MAAFPVERAGVGLARELFAVPSATFSPDVLPTVPHARLRVTVDPAVPDLDWILGNAFGRLPEVPPAGAVPGPAPAAAMRSDAPVGVPQGPPRAPRSLSERAWAARQLQGVLNDDGLLMIHRVQRRIEKPLESDRIRRDLTARARRGLDRAVREAEAINLAADRDRLVEAYEERLAEYQRFREEMENRGGGLFGTVLSLVGSVAGTMLGGPLLGAALAGAVGTVVNGGNVGEALVSAGFNAGAAYAYSVAVPTLRDALFTPVGGEPTPLGEFIDEEIAREIEEFYVEPVLDPAGDETGFGMLAARGAMRPSPARQWRRRQQQAQGLDYYSPGPQPRQYQYPRSPRTSPGTPPSPGRLIEEMQEKGWLRAAGHVVGEVKNWKDKFDKLDSGKASLIERSRVQADYERWLKDDALRILIEDRPIWLVPPEPDHGSAGR